jgi:hypothetical protein
LEAGHTVADQLLGREWAQGETVLAMPLHASGASCSASFSAAMLQPYYMAYGTHLAPMWHCRGGGISTWPFLGQQHASAFEQQRGGHHTQCPARLHLLVEMCRNATLWLQPAGTTFWGTRSAGLRCSALLPTAGPEQQLCPCAWRRKMQHCPSHSSFAGFQPNRHLVQSCRVCHTLTVAIKRWKATLRGRVPGTRSLPPPHWTPSPSPPAALHTA